MTKPLSPQQEAFLEALFDEENNPGMDPYVAKAAAGYADSTPVRTIMAAIKSTLQDDMQNYFLMHSPRAAKEIINIATDQNPIPGSEKVLAAAVQILDRAGVTKPEKQPAVVQHALGVVLLPAIDIPDATNCITAQTDSTQAETS